MSSRFNASLVARSTASKCVAPPLFLQEIRDVAEKWRQSDAGLPALSAAAPFSRRLSPNLTYDYSNRVVRIAAL